jgi:hypothetical protein
MLIKLSVLFILPTINLTSSLQYVIIIPESEGTQMEKKNQNRETWVGYRPSVIQAKKKNKKHERKEGKQICRDAMKGEKD